MTKSNQKPLYKTRFMLDELGNLQSEGHGISAFETMLSIGLGQEQQFTLILQTLQQLRDVYGDSVDKVIQGNTSNIVFLKSTDDSMLDTLQKMSGVRHRTYKESKTVTSDMQSFFKFNKNEGKQSITMTTKEEPVISYNDMAFISERNSMVFRAGNSPIWNRNETILPMSWRLFKDTIIQPGKEYTLQTIPTLSTAMDFDVRKNQPNFQKMLEKRMQQAYVSEDAQKKYQEAYGYSDYEISQLDPDTYSDEIMDLIYSTMNPEEMKEAIQKGLEGETSTVDEEELEEMFDYVFGNQDNKGSKFTANPDLPDVLSGFEANREQEQATAQEMARHQEDNTMRYAGKTISRDMLVSKTGVSHGLDAAIIKVYKEIKDKMNNDSQYFSVDAEGNLRGARNNNIYIKTLSGDFDVEGFNKAIHDENSRVYSEEDINMDDLAQLGTYEVTDHFLRFLVTFQKAWPFADGEFEKKMKAEMQG